MRVSLYRTPDAAYLPIFEELEQQIVWSKTIQNDYLLYLQDFVLRKKNLNKWWTGPAEDQPDSMVARVVGRLATEFNPFAEVRAKKEFEETGKIEGALFLAQNLQKIWLSHYDIKCLEPAQ